MVDVSQGILEDQGVGENGRGVGEPEERVVGEDCPQSHYPADKHRLVGHRGKGRMAMDQLNLLPDEDLPEPGKTSHDGSQTRAVVGHEEGKVIDF